MNPILTACLIGVIIVLGFSAIGIAIAIIRLDKEM